MNHLIAGGTQAIVGNLTGKQLDKVTGDIPYLAENGADVHRDIKTIADCMLYLCKKEDKNTKPYYERITLQPGTLIPMLNEAHDRNYNMALLSAATTVNFQVIGLGQAFSLSLMPGWNVLNMPDGTLWGLPSAAAANVSILYCASDVMFGNAI